MIVLLCNVYDFPLIPPLLWKRVSSSQNQEFSRCLLGGRENVRIIENKWLEVKLDLKIIQITYTNFYILKNIYNIQSRLSIQIQAKINTLVLNMVEIQESVKIKAKVANLI